MDFQVSKESLEKFGRDGFVVLENYLTEEECDRLKGSMRRLVDRMSPAEHVAVFTTETDEKQQKTRNEYFMNSGDKIRYFFEEEAFDKKGELKYEKLRSLNKVGHALHVLEPEFQRATFKESMKDLFRKLSFKAPAICQSMYIFKNPYIGGKVLPHQDGTFLMTEPELRVVGVWIALEDATINNGCLRFIPGSHQDGRHNDRRMVRNADGLSTHFTAELPTYDDSKFVPVPIKRGDLILIDGLVVHSSYKNTSEKSREIYTFHVIETDHCTWSLDNWLQPSKELPFPKLYDE